MNEVKQTPKNGADHNIQIYRKIIQYLFLAVIVLIGVQFALFVNQLEKDCFRPSPDRRGSRVFCRSAP
jgi:hypothetical protein